MERLIMKELRQWKDSNERKPLLLLGVRQCGKTYTIQEFGRLFFDDLAYFSLEADSKLAGIFEGDFDITRIIDELGTVIRKKPIIPGKTLLVLDEIQAVPRAITSLKYFCENLPELHVIAAGSLLGVALKERNISFPVGKVDRLNMFPMSFYEFVMANGDAGLLDGAQKRPAAEELPEIYTIPLRKHYLNYCIIGGMPEVVRKWVETHDYDEAERVQGQILEDYENDFSKHAPIELVPKIRQIWRSIPEQIAKENNKFMFSHVVKGGRARDLEDALEWLIDAGLAYKVCLIENPELPLAFKADETYFKVYFADIGLLRKKSNVYYGTILSGDDNYVGFKGALTENYCMVELLKLNLHPFFWRSGNQAELDFLTEYKGRFIPIEVKSAENTRAKSLKTFINKYNPRYAIKASLRNTAVNHVGETDLINIPLYMFWRIKEYLS